MSGDSQGPAWGAAVAGEGFDSLAAHDDGSPATAALIVAAQRRGLRVERIHAEEVTAVLPRAGRAWRCPPGFAEAIGSRGYPLALTSAPATWFAGLSAEVTGRRLTVLSVAEVLAGVVPDHAVATVKLATHKLRSFPIRRVSGVGAVREQVVGLPGEWQLLLAEQWLSCHSEYRTFTVGRACVTSSPYLVEGEPWAGSQLLRHHRASFHDDAASFVAGFLAGLPDASVPPAVVLDVARLEDGRFVLLESNSSWGAGLYGCDPDASLSSVLAANQPSDAWAWRP